MSDLIKKMVRFVSPTERAAAGLPQNVKRDSIRNLLLKAGGKQVEMDYAGLAEWLATQPERVNPEDVVQFLREKGPLREIGRLDRQGPNSAAGADTFDVPKPDDDYSIDTPQEALSEDLMRSEELRNRTRPSHHKYIRDPSTAYRETFTADWMDEGESAGVRGDQWMHDPSSPFPDQSTLEPREFSDSTMPFSAIPGDSVFHLRYTEPGQSMGLREWQHQLLEAGQNPEDYREVLFYDPKAESRRFREMGGQPPLDHAMQEGITPDTHDASYWLRYFNDEDAINVVNAQSDIGQEWQRSAGKVKSYNPLPDAPTEGDVARERELFKQFTNHPEYARNSEAMDEIWQQMNPEEWAEVSAEQGTWNTPVEKKWLADQKNISQSALSGVGNALGMQRKEILLDPAIENAVVNGGELPSEAAAALDEIAARDFDGREGARELLEAGFRFRWLQDRGDYHLDMGTSARRAPKGVPLDSVGDDAVQDYIKGLDSRNDLRAKDAVYETDPAKRIAALQRLTGATSPVVTQDKWLNFLARQLVGQAAQEGKPIMLPDPSNVRSVEGMPIKAAEVFYNKLAKEIEKAARPYGGSSAERILPDSVVKKDGTVDWRGEEYLGGDDATVEPYGGIIYAKARQKGATPGMYEDALGEAYENAMNTGAPEEVPNMAPQRAGTLISFPQKTFDAIRERGMDAFSLAAMAGAGAAASSGGEAEAGESNIRNLQSLVASLSPQERGSLLSAGEEMTPDQRAKVIADMRRENAPEVKVSGVPLDQYLSERGDGPATEDTHRYAAAVSDSLDRPVISARFVNEMLGGEDIASKYEGGYLSPRELMREMHARQQVGAIKQQYEALRKKRGLPTTKEDAAKMSAFLASVRERISQTPSEIEGRVGGVLAGTLKNDAEAEELASGIKYAVAQHGPGGQYALDASRTQSEQDTVDSERGGYGKYSLTQSGVQNQEASRLMELWGARSNMYPPASTMAQVQRAVGGLTAPIYNAVMGNGSRNTGSAWDEFSRMQRPDGKYGYAADLYWRADGDLERGGDSPIYTPEGEAKYGQYDPQNNPIGLANAISENTAFPLASWYQYLRQYNPTAGSGLAQTLGAAAGDDTAAAGKLNTLRQNYNRVTPVVPDGVDRKAYQDLGERLRNSDERLAGWNSAFLGPKFADAYNATPLANFGKMDRSYLSPFAQTAVETIGETATDPLNLVFNVGAPFVGAAVKGVGSALGSGLKAGAQAAGNSLIRNLAKAPARVVGDMAEEQVESGAIIGPGLSGFSSWFTPEKENLLMGEKDPNDPDYDEEFRNKSLDARQEQYDVASDLSELTGEKKRKPAPDRRKKPGSFTVPSIL